jgi:hypothetical protein
VKGGFASGLPQRLRRKDECVRKMLLSAFLTGSGPQTAPREIISAIAQRGPPSCCQDCQIAFPQLPLVAASSTTASALPTVSAVRAFRAGGKVSRPTQWPCVLVLGCGARPRPFSAFVGCTIRMVEDWNQPCVSIPYEFLDFPHLLQRVPASRWPIPTQPRQVCGVPDASTVATGHSRSLRNSRCRSSRARVRLSPCSRRRDSGNGGRLRNTPEGRWTDAKCL